VFLWTLSEYVLHRFVFHYDDSLPDNRVALFLHFLLHGIHHAFPMDRLRLVFPPALGILVFYSLTKLFTVFGQYQYLMITGFLVGYMSYDLTHFYIHHNKTIGLYFSKLKEYHIMHHYKNPHLGYGVSNKLWDYVFGTVLYPEEK